MNIQELDKEDPRVSYDQISKKWILEDEENGLEYEYNESLKKWVPVEDEDAVKLQQEAYGGEKEQAESKPRKKRQKEHEPTSDESKKRRKQNTGVYITGLPKDVTADELNEVFSKYGVIAEDLVTGDKKIKIYYDDMNIPKGDALILYFKPESVELAIQMMDDAPLRYDDSGKPTNKIKVEKAQFSKEGEKEKSKKEIDVQEKMVIKHRFEKLNEKLADWDDDEIDRPIPKRWEKVALFKHVFTIKELEDDQTASDIKEDLMEGCEAIGPISSVTLYDLEPEGIAMVKFKNKDDVEKCIEFMDGRFFGGNRLEVSRYDGFIKYNRTKKGDEDEQEESKRLDEFGNWLDKEK